jgi:hypothetical protein
MAFPVGQHDDMLDCLARIEDPALHLRWPEAGVFGSSRSERPDNYLSPRSAGERMRARHSNGNRRGAQPDP